MKKSLPLAAALFVTAFAASAAEIHGTISENDKPLPAGVVLKLDCGDVSASAKTDKFGSYSLKIAATGACQLSADYKGGNPSLKVMLYEKPTRYDVVVKEEGGKLSLARK
ncbi:MAG TPA: hypothetical protein VLH41_09640 [Thermoanaerobaculia bacterium]|nr:hypothetical protein [Thermoanaerobaculia bacterium]